jgi:hypothetical protein
MGPIGIDRARPAWLICSPSDYQRVEAHPLSAFGCCRSLARKKYDEDFARGASALSRHDGMVFVIDDVASVRRWKPFFGLLERRIDVGSSLTVRILTQRR